MTTIRPVRHAWTLTLALTVALAGAPSSTARDARGRTLGLALSGGGARGAAHVGVLAVLEELGVQVDLVAGTSMGAIVGGLYAAGLSPAEIEAAIGTVDWADAFKDQPPREDRSFRRKLEDDSFVVDPKLGFNGGKVQLPLGMKQGQKLQLLLERHARAAVAIDDFDRLPIPFRAVAADIETGERVVLGEGSVAMALRASMSIPGVFAPVEHEGRLLVDGGIASNLPIDLAREMGADVVIAVDISTPLRTRDELDSSVAIVSQLNGLLIRRDTDRQIASLGSDDLLVAPDLGELSSSDFDRMEEAVAAGEAAARAVAERLRALAAPGARGPARRVVEARESRPEPPVIEFVRAETDTRLDRRMLTSRLRQEIGEPLDLQQLEADIGAIYGLDVFETVSYRVVEEGGRTGLVVKGRRRHWGPDYLQFGFGLASDFAGSNSWKLGVAYTKAELNSLNAEWRNELQVGEESLFRSDFYQPLDVRSRWFVNPVAGFERDVIELRESGDPKAKYRITTKSIGLSLGRELGTWGEIRIGAVRSWNDIGLLIGERAPADEEVDGGRAFVRLSWDEMDNLDFPRRGVRGRLEHVVSRESLGAEADQEYDLWSASLSGARTWDRNTLIGGLSFDRTSSGTLPAQDLRSLGGFLELSGFADDELLGQHRGLARLVYLRTLSKARLFASHVGVSVETGNVWDEADDIGDDPLLGGSVFFGLDSPAGPIYVGVGHVEGGHTAGFFYLGRIF